MSRIRERFGLLFVLVAAAMFAVTGCGNDSSTGPVQDTTVDPGDITTIAGNGIAGLSPDGSAPTQTAFYTPMDLTFGPNGQPYIIDFNNHRVRTISGGVVQTIIGTGEIGEAPPGVATEIRLNHPTNIAFDNQDRLVLAAWHNSKVMRLDMTTGMISNFAGTGMRSFGGDGGPAISAILDLPVGVAIDPGTGDTYISDEANVRIRKVDAAGTITTICGNGTRSYTGDGGPAAAATFNLPFGQSAPPVGRIAYANGFLYLADYSNHAVRRITISSGIIETIAGTGMPGFSGDGGPATAAQLRNPTDVDVDGLGNVYIADTDNSVIRKIDTSGTITTIVGVQHTNLNDGSVHFGGDFGPATAAVLDRPHGIAFGPEGALYIADSYNNRIRKVWN